MNGKIFSVRIKFFMIYDISYLFSLSNFPHTHIISNQMIMHNMDYMPYPLYKISLYIYLDYIVNTMYYGFVKHLFFNLMHISFFT